MAPCLGLRVERQGAPCGTAVGDGRGRARREGQGAGRGGGRGAEEQGSGGDSPAAPGTWSCRRVTPAPLLLCPPPASPSRPLSLPPCPPASVAHCRAARGPLPLDPQAEAGGHGDMVTLGRPKPAAMSSGAATPPERARGSSLTPDRYKPFSSQAHYQQVMLALRKLRESGFYWGAVGGREASALLRSQAPGTFLVRDSSDHRHFFTLSVQTVRGTKNLRIHSERGGFFLQPDPHSARQPPQFDCVLKLIAHYMGKGPPPPPPPPQEPCRGEAGAGAAAAVVAVVSTGTGTATGGGVYLIHSDGEKLALELRRPLSSSLSSLQHLCRRTLNSRHGGGVGGLPGGGGGLAGGVGAEQLPHTLRDFLEEYDAPI
ncbi:hypothetical protein CRUP_033300 [Coryphaenoides rupestris]|nr:hypothetical protein CRUP_033300 [Coryphaenoides rupestris]